MIETYPILGSILMAFGLVFILLLLMVAVQRCIECIWNILRTTHVRELEDEIARLKKLIDSHNP